MFDFHSFFFSNENDAISINQKKADSIFNKSESEWAMIQNFETVDVAWRLVCKKKKKNNYTILFQLLIPFNVFGVKYENRLNLFMTP